MLCLYVSTYRCCFVIVVAVTVSSENMPFSLGLHMISFFISVFIFVILDSRYFHFCCFILFLPLGWKPQNSSVLKSGFLVVIHFHNSHFYEIFIEIMNPIIFDAAQVENWPGRTSFAVALGPSCTQSPWKSVAQSTFILKIRVILSNNLKRESKILIASLGCVFHQSEANNEICQFADSRLLPSF